MGMQADMQCTKNLSHKNVMHAIFHIQKFIAVVYDARVIRIGREVCNVACKTRSHNDMNNNNNVHRVI